MTNLEIIRKACIKANPEIMELKFGCVIKTKKFSFENNLETITYDGTIGIDREFGLLGRDNKIFEKDIIEILGREIRLADVLLALTQDRGSRWHMITYKKWNANIMRDDVEKFINWDLKNDNLELQSEETIKFLAELLK